MSISYIQSAQSKGCNDSFAGILKECAEEFKTTDLNVFSAKDFEEVVNDENLYNRYSELLGAQLCSDEQEAFAQMAKNNRLDILANEGGAIGTIAPMSFLSTPMLRKSWARLAMPKAIPTEAVEKPKFTINYWHPWIMNPIDGIKHYAPEDLADIGDAVTKVKLAEDVKFQFTNNCFSMNLFTGKDVDMAGNDTNTTNYAKGGLNAAPKYKKVLELGEKAIMGNDEVDVNFSIVQAGFKVPQVGDTVVVDGLATTVKKALTVNGEAVTAEDLIKNVKIQVASRVMAFKGTVAISLDVDADCVGGAEGDVAKVTIQDNFYGDVDVKTGRFSGTCVAGKLDYVMIRAFVSSMMNNANIQVGFDIRDKEVDIGSGEHIEAPVPNEYVTDLLRMFNFQGVTRLLEVMSNFIAQKVDLDAIAFIDTNINDFIEQNPGQFTTAFSAKPVGSYNLNPVEWKKVLPTLIDHVSARIINKFHYEQGYFSLICNPLDAHLFPQVDWVFNSGASKEHSGVTSNYSYGTFQGIYSYNMVASPNVPQGFIRMVFIPTVEDQMTMKFYPYSFTVEQPGSGYNSPNNGRVPTIMAHRRYTFQEVLPGYGKITITNNSAAEMSYAGTSPYLPTDTHIG
jgi:hypothetical protein